MFVIMSNKPNINITLPIDSCNLILEALLFASSVDICANWQEDTIKDMIHIATQIKNTIGEERGIELKNIYLYKDVEFEDLSITKEINKDFKKLLKTERLLNTNE